MQKKLGGSKDIVFIDANIYLRFYDSVNPKMSSLLAALTDIGPALLVTTQIRDEVIRNRAKVATDLLDGFIAKIAMPSAHLPETLVPACAAEVTRWNKDYDAVCNASKQGFRNRLQDLRNQLVDAVVSGTDGVSQALAVLFSKAMKHNDAQLQRARDRIERGNPPGKSKDTLGDQLSWEQLLDSFDPEKRLWIVSQDYDFFVALTNDEARLSPFLMDELRDQCGGLNPNVRCFVDLRKALEELRKVGGFQDIAIPTAAELPGPRVSIEQYHLANPSGMLEYVVPELQGIVPGICPKCGGVLAGASWVSAEGRASWSLMCTQCRSHFVQP